MRTPIPDPRRDSRHARRRGGIALKRGIHLLKPGKRPRAASDDKDGPSRAEELLAKASEKPDDPRGWIEAYDQALRESRLDLATRAAENMGEAGRVRRAELAVLRGAAGEAVMMLKDRSDSESRSMLAWALFCMDQRLPAATLWMMAGTEDEAKLGRAISLLLRNRPLAEMIDLLATHIDSSNLRVAAASAKLSAEIHARLGDRPRALTCARRAEWLMPFDIELKRLVARTASAAGQGDLSRDRWREIAERQPEDAEAQEMLGHAALAEKNDKEAAERFEKALAVDPFRGNLRILLGDMAAGSDRMEEAVEHWETALRLNPRDRNALSRLAEMHWDNGDIPESLDLFLRIKDLGFAPEEEEEHFEMIGYLFSEVVLSGEKKREVEAARFFEETAGKFPANPLLKVYQARYHVAREDYAGARPLIEEALKSAPLMPEAVFEMGNLLWLEGRREEGTRLLQKAATLDDDPFYRKELGKRCLDVEDWAGAEKWFKRALSQGTEDDELLTGLFFAFFNQRKFAMAENVLRRVLALTPESLQALVYLAETLLYLGRNEEACEIMMSVKDVAISYEDYTEGEGAPEMVVDPFGVVHWLTGLAAFFTDQGGLAKKHLRIALDQAGDMREWFVELGARAVAEAEADPNRYRRLKAAALLLKSGE